MRYREYGISVATVGDDLLNEYKRITETPESELEIVKRVIEDKILFRKIKNRDDIGELKKIAKNLFYNLPGEMIERFLREEIENSMRICKNCPYLKDNVYCPLLNVEVNPYFESCGTI